MKINLNVLYSAMIATAVVGAVSLFAMLFIAFTIQPNEPPKLVNPISYERYMTARLDKLENQVECLRDRMDDPPDLVKVFPCVSAGQRTLETIQKYEMWEKLHGN